MLLSGCNSDKSDHQQPDLSTRALDLLTIDGYQFKDHNKNGELDSYEDWRLSPEQRAADLISQMSVEEKAGLMMHGTLVLNSDSTRLDFDTATVNNTTLIHDRLINTLITRQNGDISDIAADNNRIQELAESTRLGIPASISSDPRNHFNAALGTSVGAGQFSKWTETLGLAAIGDEALTKQFADIIRQEYLAAGINQALHPTADIATEPRWGRNNSTFGEDAELAKRMTKAYTQGLQNSDSGLVKDGVWAVVKHYAGGGPQEHGFDAHHFVGRKQVYPGNNFDYHRIPFKGAFEAGIAGVMPYYGIPEGQLPAEEGAIAFGYSKYVMTDLLRGEENFDGVLISDWLVANDCEGPCRTGVTSAAEEAMHPFSYLGMPWGLENVDKAERFARSVDAGIDQFGGIDDPAPLISVIHSGRISTERIDLSVTRILTNKFKQGLFESAFVDEEQAIKIVGKSEFQQQADISQRRSVTLLKNEGDLLPASLETLGKVYLHGLDTQTATDYGLSVVDTMADADTIIIRTQTPATITKAWLFGMMMPSGELGFMSDTDFQLQDYELAADSAIGESAQYCYEQYPPYGTCHYSGASTYTLIQDAIASGKRVLLDVFLIRPVALGNLEPDLGVITANYGTSDEAYLDVITGKYKPEGKLPFGLPVSTELVATLGKEDLPSFQEAPEITLFPFGHGLSYK